jgi:hypothetical protein
MPLILQLCSSLYSSRERASEPRINKKRERGSPCLKPLPGENMPKELPLIRMEKEIEDMQVSIHLVHVE